MFPVKEHFNDLHLSRRRQHNLLNKPIVAPSRIADHERDVSTTIEIEIEWSLFLFTFRHFSPFQKNIHAHRLFELNTLRFCHQCVQITVTLPQDRSRRPDFRLRSLFAL